MQQEAQAYHLQYALVFVNLDEPQRRKGRILRVLLHLFRCQLMRADDGFQLFPQSVQGFARSVFQQEVCKPRIRE